MSLLEIGVCTYRRQHLAITLRSIADLILPEEVILRVIVADNDEIPSARGLVEGIAAETGLDILYLHAPSNNVAIARNACLEVARGRWLAFLDDDQTVDRSCMAILIKTMGQSCMAAVFGVTLAQYPEGTPPWMVALDTHSDIPTSRKGHVLTGFSGNVLIDLTHDAVKGLRFDTAFGAGGEDTTFFFALGKRGGSMRIEKTAIAHAPIARDRLSFGWLFRRKFKAGKNYGQGLDWPDRLSSLGKCIVCGCMSVIMIWHRVRRNFWVIRGAFHAGVVSRLFY